jgi:hypothetical protein
MRIAGLCLLVAAFPPAAIAGPLVPTKPSQIVTLATSANTCSPGTAIDQ